MLGIAYKGWQTRDDAQGVRLAARQPGGRLHPRSARAFPSGRRRPRSHPRCRCWLIRRRPAGSPRPANKKRKRGVNLDGEVVIADAEPGDANPAGGGGRTLYPHRADGTEVPGGVPGAYCGRGAPALGRLHPRTARLRSTSAARTTRTGPTVAANPRPARMRTSRTAATRTRILAGRRPRVRAGTGHVHRRRAAGPAAERGGQGQPAQGRSRGPPR